MSEQSENGEGPDYSSPVLTGSGSSDYERYLRTDELLALQKTPDEQVHRDELLFQTVHQSSELWLKFASTEVGESARLLDAGEVWAAIRLVRRAVTALGYVTTALEMLEQMSPWEYQEIRVVLGHGSGFDSPGFRTVAAATRSAGRAFYAAVARAGQGELLARTNDLRADIVIAGLPNEGEPLCDALIDAIQPKVIVIADSEFPATRRAGRALKDRLEQKTIPVIYTRSSGAVEIATDKRGWKLQTMDGLEFSSDSLSAPLKHIAPVE